MFTSEVSDQLKFYVYRLIDPRNGETFYVGKGLGNRVFAHVKGELGTYREELCPSPRRGKLQSELRKQISWVLSTEVPSGQAGRLTVGRGTLCQPKSGGSVSQSLSKTRERSADVECTICLASHHSEAPRGKSKDAPGRLVIDTSSPN